jgi:polyphosphate kinase
MSKLNGNGHPIPLTSKEVSWLSFNERVLDEASDVSVPLLERFRFLGIYSSNLDEFFRVRVATLNRLSELPSKKAIALIGHDPRKVLKKVHRTVLEQQVKFDQIYQQLLKDLAKEHIYIIDEKQLTPAQGEVVKEYFHTIVRPKLFPIMLSANTKFPELKDKSIYLAVTLSKKKGKDKPQYALIEVPTDTLSRFLILPQISEERFIMLLDDVIRYNLPAIFSALDYDTFGAYTIKLTRDAELDIDHDMFESYVRKVHKSLKQRKEGDPVRLVVDSRIPSDLLKLIVKKLELGKNDPVILGSRYHNYKDFTNFPEIGRKLLRYTPLPQLMHPAIANHKSILETVTKKDLLLTFPYHTFDHMIDLLREASIDPDVTSIKITLYRAAQNSSVVNALMNAAKNGKSVVAVVELQARFDEEANIFWANQLQEVGAKVVFGVPGLKVHMKVCLITRTDQKTLPHVVAIGTGNFNEDTARVYTDHLLLTANKKITKEADRLFEFLENNYKKTTFSQLLVSPFNMRRKLNRLIQTEIDNAEKGKRAYIYLKLNHLTDSQIIRQLYKASQAGVTIRLVVRGMFSLQPGVSGISDNISAVRIVDRFLEHLRIMIFANGGNEKYYISSGDWMPRNLDRRIEVACPIIDPELKQEIKDMFEFQWRDNTKSRPYEERQNGTNHKKPKAAHRAQMETYEFLHTKGLSEPTKRKAGKAK